ncbi:MAG: methyltransferase type 11 [Epsilonproteobacteria bacterium]|nr:methyltransferase type 11 [Campylobacterota bacterium]|tara:strand:- start:5027 stop:5767 length:741 start_codon:yes stop_codon:yes gene_type:complete
MKNYPDYGIDAPTEIKKILYYGVVWSIVYYLLFKLLHIWLDYNFLLTLAHVLPALSLAVSIIPVILMYFSSKISKFWQRDKLLKQISWKGDEQVLDVGCGAGLLLIGVAKHLHQNGRAIGIDIWSDIDLSNNAPGFTLRNAELEGVQNRLEVHTADVRQLPFEKDSFDIVVSSLVIHNIESEQERNKALDEMLRVLKPGGTLLLQDILYTKKYFEYLKTSKKVKYISLSDLQWYIFPAARFIKLIK